MPGALLGYDGAVLIRRRGRVEQDATLGAGLARLVAEAPATGLQTWPNAGELVVGGAAAFAYGELAYIHTDGTALKAENGGTQAQAYAEAICVEPLGIPVGAAGLFLLGEGIVTGLAGGSAGAFAFVDATAGAIYTHASDVPSATWIKKVGRWLSATALKFSAPTAFEPLNFG